jgi:hypothetical protein
VPDFYYPFFNEIYRPSRAVETAHVYFHRFFAFHGFNDHDRLYTCISCIFLAAKVEECSQKMERVAQACLGIANRVPTEMTNFRTSRGREEFRPLREKVRHFLARGDMRLLCQMQALGLCSVLTP